MNGLPHEPRPPKVQHLTAIWEAEYSDLTARAKGAIEGAASGVITKA